jgi:hypothetical protein
MLTIQELLNRFRPAGAPGAAGGAGVPVDRRAELTAELVPVFAALADTAAEVGKIRSAGTDRAERRRREATGEAARIVARARMRSEADRADAFAAARADTANAAADLIDRGRREADEVRRRTGTAMAGYVADLVDAALAEVFDRGQAAPAEPVAVGADRSAAAAPSVRELP